MTCGICGATIRVEVAADSHPVMRARRMEREMQAHLTTHSFAAVLRYEIRQDLNQVPDEQRPAIMRDLYRSLLGTTSDGVFTLDDPDARGFYSIDDVLGDLDVYRLWRSANACGDARCQH